MQHNFPIFLPPGSALVLFSGGQDSTTCLLWALAHYQHVETFGVDYGQRHQIELSCRHAILKKIPEQFPQWGAHLAEDHLIDLNCLGQISQTALTQAAEITFSQENLPNTFVPGRNLLFFTLAAAIAYRRSLRVLIGGMCETDFSGYPDCRDDTLKALQASLNLGMNQRFIIETPLMWLNKAQTWQLADQLARDYNADHLLHFICEETHTCYLGDRTQRHDWGYGCAQCPACLLRAEGYRQFIADKDQKK